MGNLPNWAHADKVYSNAYKVLENMGKSGHVIKPIYKRGKVFVQGSVSQEMRELIEALGRGDETEIKSMLLNRGYFEYR